MGPATTSNPGTGFGQLPADLVVRVLNFVFEAKSVARAMAVCRTFRDAGCRIQRASFYLKCEPLPLMSGDLAEVNLTNFVMRCDNLSELEVTSEKHYESGPPRCTSFCPATVVAWLIHLKSLRRLKFENSRPLGEMEPLRPCSPLLLLQILRQGTTLEELELTKFAIPDALPAFQLPLLTTLCLVRVEVASAAVLQALLAGCPSLRIVRLILVDVNDGRDSITVSSPSIEEFGLWNCLLLGVSVNAPNLRRLDVIRSRPLISVNIANVPKLTQLILKESGISDLKVDSWPELSRLEVSVTHHRWEVLKQFLEVILEEPRPAVQELALDLDRETLIRRRMPVFIDMIMSYAPKVERLAIGPNLWCCLLEAVEYPPSFEVWDTLRELRIETHDVSHCSFQLIWQFLERCRALEKIVIRVNVIFVDFRERLGDIASFTSSVNALVKRRDPPVTLDIKSFGYCFGWGKLDCVEYFP